MRLCLPILPQSLPHHSYLPPTSRHQLKVLLPQRPRKLRHHLPLHQSHVPGPQHQIALLVPPHQQPPRSVIHRLRLGIQHLVRRQPHHRTPIRPVEFRPVYLPVSCRSYVIIPVYRRQPYPLCPIEGYRMPQQHPYVRAHRPYIQPLPTIPEPRLHHIRTTGTAVNLIRRIRPLIQIRIRIRHPRQQCRSIRPRTHHRIPVHVSIRRQIPRSAPPQNRIIPAYPYLLPRQVFRQPRPIGQLPGLILPHHQYPTIPPRHRLR